MRNNTVWYVIYGGEKYNQYTIEMYDDTLINMYYILKLILEVSILQLDSRLFFSFWKVYEVN